MPESNSLTEKIEIIPFFTQVYIDEEMKRLGKKFSSFDYIANIIPSTLSKAEMEKAAFIILAIGKLNRNWCGVDIEELKRAVSPYHYCIARLITYGFFREALIENKTIVFPTEKLMINQRVPGSRI